MSAIASRLQWRVLMMPFPGSDYPTWTIEIVKPSGIRLLQTCRNYAWSHDRHRQSRSLRGKKTLSQRLRKGVSVWPVADHLLRDVGVVEKTRPH